MQGTGFDKRRSGIPLIGDLPWGTHFCQFYETKKDLLDILIPYLRSGLLGNELCVWVTCPSLGVAEAETALKNAVPNFENYARNKQVEIIPCGDWLSGKIIFDKNILMRLDKAVSKGFDGLRLACGIEPQGDASHDFGSIAKYNMVAAFAYPRNNFDTLGLMEVVKKHNFALVRNAGRWEVIETQEARTAKDTLKRSEEKVRSVFRNMSEGFAYHRILLNDKGKPLDYIFLEVNEAFERLTGLSAKNIIGKRVTEVLPRIKDDPSDWIDRYGKVALSQKPIHFESYSQALKKWFSVSVFSPYRGYFAVTFSDITGRKEYLKQLTQVNEELYKANKELSIANKELRAETEERQRIENVLRVNEGRLNKAQEIAHLGSWELDVLRNKLFWSDEVYRIFGLKPQEFSATYEAFLKAVHPQDRKAVDKAYRQSLRKGRDSYEIQHRILRKSTNEIRYVVEKCRHFRDKNGKVIRSMGLVHDITESKLAEEKIKHFAGFPQLNPNPVLEVDEGGKIIFSNPACLKALKGLGVSNRVNLFLPRNFGDIISKLKSGRKKEFLCEVNIKNAVFMEIISFLPQLKVVRIYANDITGRKRAEDALRWNEKRNSILSEAASWLLAAEEPQAVIDKVAQKTMKFLDCQVFLNFLAVPKENELRLNAYAGLRKKEALHIKEDPRAELVRSYGIRAYCCHPLLAGKKVLGTLSFGTTRRDRFTPEEIYMMKLTSDIVAIALQRKLGENAIEESQQRYLTLFEQSPDGVLIVDPVTMNTLEFNSRACEQLGYTRKEFAKLRITDYEAFETGQQTKNRINRIIIKGKDSFETRHRMKNGDLKEMQVQVKKIRLMGRDFLLCVYHDISLFKELQGKLEEARSHLEAKVEERTEELLQTNRHLIKEILERKEIERQIRARGAALKIMGRSATRKEYLDTLVKYIKGLSGCRYAGIRVLSAEGEIPYESYIGFSNAFRQKENWLSIDRDECVCIRVMTGRSLIQDASCMTKGGSFVSNDSLSFINSLSEEERSHFRGICIKNGFKSIAVIPVHYKNKIVAVMHVADERRDMLPLPKIEFMELLTPLIGEGIHKFDIEDRIRQNYISQSLISSLIKYSFEKTTTENILNRCLDLLLSMGWLGFERKAGIFLAGDKPGILELKAGKNLSEAMDKGCVEIVSERHLCGKCLKERQIQLVNTAAPRQAGGKGGSGRYYYCIPIVSGQDLLGVMKFYLPAGYRRDYKKEDFLTTVSGALAVIIERKKAEEGLKRSSERIISILESVTDGFLALDKDWKFTYVNEAAERILGVDRAEILGKGQWLIFPELIYTQIYSEEHIAMAEKKSSVFQMQFPYNNKWLEFHIYSSEDGISIYLKDVTEKKIGEEKLKDAQVQLENARRLSYIGTLAATVAHELRNPLAAMRMAAFNIKRKAQNPSLDKHLMNIEKKIYESDQIINNLLFYSRLKQPHYENVDLYSIMDECIEIAKKRACAVAVSVKKKYRVLNRFSVEADPLQMKELFTNILNNAYDAMHGNPGAIEIGALSVSDNTVRIYFKDTGSGIEEEHLKRVHEPFFTTKAKGTGLGLTVCFQIVSLHKGELELESEKGKGTTVTVTLPINCGNG